MHHGIKSYISINNAQSEICNVDVRQGGNVSPVLFSIYLNDPEAYLLSHSCNDVFLVIDENDILLQDGICLLRLLYADDIHLNYNILLTFSTVIVLNVLNFNGTTNNY